ncbi:MAG TPA: hypothetical protein VN579_07310, partial [Bryobacteraceae bacterium]|nr:hypothetical protein [Bryobacteraceae bacterium]
MPEVRGGQLSAAQTFPAANVFTQTATLAGMARRRGQRKGYLRIEGGSWLLTYRVYVPGKRLPDRVTKTIGPANGPGKLTEKQAQRFAWDHYLAPLDQAVLRPLSMVTLGEYWKLKYKPWLEASRKKTTRGQYISLFENYVMPALGETRLCELNSDMVEEVMASAKSAGKSPSTAKHIRKVISGMFTRAKKAKLVAGDNPAGLAEAPKPARTRQRVLLTPELGAALLSILPSALHPTHFPVSIEENVKCVVRPMPARWSHAYREMALTAAITSMNAAELCGLKWGFVNLTDDPAVFEGEVIAPREIAVRWHWKLGEYTSLKTNSRSRSLPIPEDLHALLSALKAATECGRP